VGVNRAFWSIALYRGQAGKKLAFEALSCGIALRLSDQLSQTGELVSVEHGSRCLRCDL
jgi:hypothetical protein